jgi:hypothetical protein
MALSAVLLLCAAQVPLEPVLTAELTTKPGWMSGGWGGYRLSVKNPFDNQPVRILSWEAHWEAKGKRVGDPWKADLKGEQAPAGGTWTKNEVGYLPPEVVAAAKPQAPVMVGKVVVIYELNPGSRKYTGTTLDLPFKITVPAATLPEKLKLIKGKTLGLELMESRYKNFPSAKRALKWLDEAYQAMIDLTGYHPFDGKLMVIQEAPEHPYWAYAGNPVVMNTKFVPQQIEDINKGLMPFGWVHEVGHNFDVYGKWYIWNGPSAEMQANFKLAYAFEVVEKKNTGSDAFKVKRGGFSGPSYPSVHKEETMTGRQFVDAFFTLHGDAYLADPKRTWDSMTSDEIHSFLQRIQVAYGWEPFKRMYRWYQLLENQGLKPPETDAGKVQLMAAILSLETKVDLVPIFQRWRMPVSKEDVAKMKSTYGVDK